jgi:hypothetical protein
MGLNIYLPRIEGVMKHFVSIQVLAAQAQGLFYFCLTGGDESEKRRKSEAG